MGSLDYGILLLLGLWLIFALRPRKRGCGGSCECCSRHCGQNPRAK
ncbi:hypothetical protein H8790_04200 [Oscillibacter hominis]|uniref:FeoB-associated Cys-rich membrane protein n=1 Tax=Oscillibacter hominis TaxID=2763056 RepID=A0A7G9B6P7_9FIRM|nr:hypothetical protein [Oscillibacter hominis]QNL45228.1 hypothetical protein H8790_04200 [Oscillibacter hominis]